MRLRNYTSFQASLGCARSARTLRVPAQKRPCFSNFSSLPSYRIVALCFVYFVSTQEVRPKDEVPVVEETAAEDAVRTANHRKKPKRRAGHEGVIKVSQLGA